MCGIPVDAVRPDERGREDRALLGASENAEVRRAAERVRGLKRDASRGLRAEEEGHRDEVGGRENRRGLSRRIEALDHGNEAAVVGRGLGKRDLHRLPRPDLAFREHLPRKDAPGELGRAARHVDVGVLADCEPAKGREGFLRCVDRKVDAALMEFGVEVRGDRMEVEPHAGCMTAERARSLRKPEVLKFLR